MTTCTYIMVISGLLSVIGLAIGLNKAPYRHRKSHTIGTPEIGDTTAKPIKISTSH